MHLECVVLLINLFSYVLCIIIITLCKISKFQQNNCASMLCVLVESCYCRKDRTI